MSDWIRDLLEVGKIVPATPGMVRSDGTELASVDEIDVVGGDAVLRTSIFRWEAADGFLSPTIEIAQRTAAGDAAALTIRGQTAASGAGGAVQGFAGGGSTTGGDILWVAGHGTSGSGGNHIVCSGGGAASGSILEYVGGSPTGGGTPMRSVSEDGHDFHGKPLKNHYFANIPLIGLGTGSAWLELWSVNITNLVVVNRTRRFEVRVAIRPPTSDYTDVVPLTFNIARGVSTVRFVDVQAGTAGGPGNDIGGTITGVINSATSVSWRLRYYIGVARLEFLQDPAVNLGVGVREVHRSEDYG